MPSVSNIIGRNRRIYFNCLCEHYSFTTDEDEWDEFPSQFAACCYGGLAGDAESAGDGAVTTWDTLEEALESMGVQVLEGFSPDAVYDLDTRERIEVHVSTPVVTKSEEQGTMLNPLAHEDDDAEAEGVSIAEVDAGRRALAALRDIHCYLWPELYPATDQRVIEHGRFNPDEDECHEWDASTVEIVGTFVRHALADDPMTPKDA